MTRRKLIGDKAFYRSALAIALPIMLQNGITNFVSLLDNIMVGRLGTESVSGVSIVNQFVFIFNLLIFGATSAAGIFTAQFHGAGNVKGVRQTFRFKVIINLFAGILATLVFYFFREGLINFFLHEEGTQCDLALAYSEAEGYLIVILFGLIPYSIAQAYASTLKETEETVMPLIASTVAVGVNFGFNLILIFGYLGFPALGVVGAAIATTLSRFVELFILVLYTHMKKERHEFIKGAYKELSIDAPLIKEIAKKGLPVMANELLWSMAMTYRNSCYSTRGLEAFASSTISSTVFNVFSVTYMALGVAISILVGNRLGRDDIEGAKDTATKMQAFSVFMACGIGVVLAAVSPALPLLYDVAPEVRSLATYMLLVSAILMPFFAFANACYFTIRSGGQVLATMLLDSVFMWVIVCPICFVLSSLTSISIYWLFPICQATEILKVAFGVLLLKKSNWAKKLID